MRHLQLLLLLLTGSGICYTYNILLLFPHPGLSHHYAFEPMFRSLLKRGHNLTHVTHFPLVDPPSNYNLVNLSGSYKIYSNLMTFDRQKGSILGNWFHLKDVFEYIRLGVRVCDIFLDWPSVQPLFDTDGQEFDLVMTEAFNSDCSLGFVDKYKKPHVTITSNLMMPWNGDRFGAVEHPAFVPIYFAHHGSRTTFWDRLENTFFLHYHKWMYYLWSTRKEEVIMRKRFGDDMPSLLDIAKNTSLIFLNTHQSLSGIVPRAPNIVEIGGMHVRTPKPLPKDLEKYINDSPHGVIYFSMGSMIKGTSISPEKLTAIQAAFAELPQRVLWKWENDTMQGIPENVMVRKWLPQLDILSHKNVKAFISHGGMLSTTEAAHCGVPLIAIPLFGDQFANGAAAEESGLGMMLEYRDITKDTFLAALKRVLDPKIQKSAKKLSAIWRDRPMSPLDTAVYWIEHVAKHGGAHLRPVSADLPLYQYLLLDVIAFMASVVFLGLYIFFKVFSLLLNRNKTKSKKE